MTVEAKDEKPLHHKLERFASSLISIGVASQQMNGSEIINLLRLNSIHTAQASPRARENNISSLPNFLKRECTRSRYKAKSTNIIPPPKADTTYMARIVLTDLLSPQDNLLLLEISSVFFVYQNQVEKISDREPIVYGIIRRCQIGWYSLQI